MKNQNFLRRLNHSFHGLKSAWDSERSFRTQVVITVLVLIALFILKPSIVWASIFCLVIGSTLAAELFNTALEAVIDVLHPEIHPQIGKAKDCAAAAVLVLSISSAIIFFIFLYQKFISNT